MANRIGIVLLLVNILACSSPQPVPDIEVCVTDERLRPAVEAAAERWSDALGIWVDVGAGACDQNDLVVMVTPELKGWGCSHDGLIAIRESIVTKRADQLEPLMVHEMGHEISGHSDHTTELGTIMYPTTGAGLNITAEDNVLVCRNPVVECRTQIAEAEKGFDK